MGTYVAWSHQTKRFLPPAERNSYDARIEVEKALEAKGLLRGKEKNKMRLGICSRSGDIIEPYLTPQWWVLLRRLRLRQRRRLWL